MTWRCLLGALCLLLARGAFAQNTSTDDLQQQIDDLRRIIDTQQRQIERLRGLIEGVGPEVAAPVPPPPPGGTPARRQVDLYGFVRLDAIWDSGRTNNTQTPTWVNAGGSGNSSLALHPRLTRLGLDWHAPERLGDWQASGRLELDWQNGGRESRAIPRYRQAYLQLARGPQRLLLGQTWDLISPLYPSPNDDTLMWNAGNLGDRRAQIRYTHQPEEDDLQWAVALGLTGAVDSQDLDNDGEADGEDSSLPHLQARVAWHTGGGAVGLWGHHAWERVNRPVAGERTFTSYSVGLDVVHQLAPRWRIQGEVWTGRNLSDFRGGIGQGVNTATGAAIDSRGGWIEARYQRTGSHRLAVGYSLDDPSDGDLPAGGRTRNQVWWLHNLWSLGGTATVGLNYLYWVTDWQGQASGIDHRLSSFIQHSF